MTMHKALKSAKISRRGFVAGSAGLTFALAIGGGITGRMASAAAAAGSVTPNAWVTIGTDDIITIMSPASEMGQGVMTSLPLIFAEELDADWSKVRIKQSPPGAPFGSPIWGGLLITGGSFSVRGYMSKLRMAGAQARRVLLDNVARKWKVPVAELSTEPSIVVHKKSGRRIAYGEVASFAIMPKMAPKLTKKDLKPASQFRLIGKDVPRVDVPSKVDGTALYGMDMQLPGMLFAAVLRAPVLGSGPAKVDDAEAKKVKGVTAVIPLPYGVAIVGTTVEGTKKAKALLKVVWKTGLPSEKYSSDEAIKAFLAVARDKKIKEIGVQKVGDAEKSMKGAAKVLTADYLNDHAYHATMEPMNATALVAPDGKSAEIWVGTQVPSLVQIYASFVLSTKKSKVTPDKIKVNTLMLGGGFGRRLENDFVVDAVILSNATKKPVKVIWSREDDVRNDSYRPLAAQHLEAGLDKNGKIIAWHQRLVCDNVAARFDPATYKKNKGSDLFTHQDLTCKYEIKNRLGEYVRRTGGVKVGYWRAVGSGYTKFASESFLDEIAKETGKDPVELRLSLLAKNPRMRKMIETVARMSNWGGKREGTALGISTDDYYQTMVAQVAEVSIDRKTGEIKVHNLWCTVDPGLVIQPDMVSAQIESGIVYGLSNALYEEVQVKNGVVQQSNFDTIRVMRHADVPMIEVKVFATDNPPGGIGEAGVPPTGAAIGNAVAALTGARLRRMPFLPDRVLEVLKG